MENENKHFGTRRTIAPPAIGWVATFCGLWHSPQAGESMRRAAVIVNVVLKNHHEQILV